MNKTYKFRKQKIYFFESTQQIAAQNTLKEFLYFLKFIGHNRIDFSYSAATNALHQNLSIKENYILDAIPKSLIKDNENNVQDFLGKLDNPFLKELIAELGDLTKAVSSLSSSELKLASFTKTILSSSQFILFEAPEKGLIKSELNLVKKCIEFEAIEKSRIVLIKSSQQILWPEIITHIVSKDENQNFLSSKNPLFETQKKTKTISDQKVRSLVVKKAS